MVLRRLSMTLINIRSTTILTMISSSRHMNTMINSRTKANGSTTNNISKFYNGAHVFLTGGTGLVGKVLIEKLLRSCDGIESIYILLRSKQGVGVDERLNNLLKSPAFDKIRAYAPKHLDKVKPIAGDVCQTNLGLSAADRRLLVDKVDIVLHSAANVKFNQTLKAAVIANTRATKYVTDLCKEMAGLKSFVHVSTIFSNPDLPELEEQVYDSIYDPEAVINLVETLPPQALSSLTAHIRGKHPNTYTISKKLAERLVLQFSKDAAAAIVRPSVISASWKEPSPGWVDTFTSATGMFMECARGSFKSVICDPQKRIDFIPVDIVANTVIAAAWHTVAHRSNTMRVYNCTSGQINGIIWKDVRNLVQKYAVEYPSKHVLNYPGFIFTTNRTRHQLNKFAFQYVPACWRDSLLYITGRQPTNVRTYNITTKAVKTGEYFGLHEWKFNVSSFMGLVEAVSKAEDGKDFGIDMSKGSGFEWDSYIKNYMLGIRLYMLKDDLSSLEEAKTKLNRLYWSKKAIQILTVGMLVGLLLL